MTEVVSYSSVTVTLRSSANSEPAGLIITFSAQVATTGPPANGQIAFQDNGRQIATMSLTGTGAAVTTINSLAIGTHIITAVYSGDANYASQSVSLSQVVSANVSAMTISASPILHTPVRL